MRSLQAIILCLLLAFVSLATTSSWEDSKLDGPLVRRQDLTDTASKGPSSTRGGGPTSTAPSQTSGTSASSTSALSTNRGLSGSSTRSGSNSGSISGSNSESKSGSGSGSRSSRKPSSTVDPRLPPGGIQMITPSANAVPTYVKIGDTVTFKWNYTSLVVTPSAVDVVAFCSKNNNYYTISSNQTYNSTGEVTWDTGATATVPLLTESYTLMVYDTEKGPSGAAAPGQLGSSSQYRFGMYIRKKYTPLNQFTCATCNGAMSSIERQTLGFLFGMVTITILSFTWFATGFGLFL